MAYFIRDTKGGGADYDPRQKHWMVYMCDVCGETSYFERVPQFQKRDRKCQNCGSMGKKDRARELNIQKDDIVNKMNELQEQLDKIENELSSLTVRA